MHGCYWSWKWSCLEGAKFRSFYSSLKVNFRTKRSAHSAMVRVRELKIGTFSPLWQCHMLNKHIILIGLLPCVPGPHRDQPIFRGTASVPRAEPPTFAAILCSSTSGKELLPMSRVGMFSGRFGESQTFLCFFQTVLALRDHPLMTSAQF